MTLNQVSNYYDTHVQDEDQRLNEHVFEIPLTLHFIDRYVAKGATILDIACGTGRYAEILLERGYYLVCGDISKKSVELTRERIGSHPNLLALETADARSSSLWQNKTWDAVLMLGPMYHLVEYQSRVDLLKKAKKHLKPGGLLFTAFMTRSGALVYGVKQNPEGIRSPEGARKLWETGTDKHFVEATEWFTHAYFSHPEEINPLLKKSGLTPLHLAGAEGIFGERFEEYHQLPENLKARWKKFIIDHCEDTQMIAQSKHLLSVSKK